MRQQKLRVVLGEKPLESRVGGVFPLFFFCSGFNKPFMSNDSGNQSLPVVIKRFETPDEVRTMTKGRFELVHLGGMTIGRATYEPGWKWSEHVGPGVGARRCHVEHIGLVLAGTATAAFDDGRVFALRTGELFHIPAEPHDSWVVGDELYVSLHFLGAAHYARN